MNEKVIEKEDIKKYFLFRDELANKGDFGKVGLIGGSLEYSGAIKLASKSCAALRAGSGLVRVIVPKEIAQGVMPFLLEQTLATYDCLDDVRKNILDINALAIGMGLGKKKINDEILKMILTEYKGRVVIDADGLNILAKHLELLENTKSQVVLTPHLKEFSRLTNISISKLKENLVGYVKEFAKKYHIILLLKGHETIISDGQRVYLVKKGGAGMATSGSGDVLSGILVGMLGYLSLSLEVVASGAYLNGLAGEIAQDKYTDIALIARDTIESIGEAIKIIRK